ncbi:MAG TPA: septum formation family protein, partial [Actinoplanes sp.]
NLTEASGKLDTGTPNSAASLLDQQVLPTLRRLDVLVPPHLHRRTASLRNEVAIMFNNCASRLVEDVGPVAEKSARGWLSTATELASDPQTIEAITQNGATLTELLAAFAMIRARVEEFVSLGRRDLARKLLRDLRRKMGDVPGAGELDRMLAELDGRGSTYAKPGGTSAKPGGTYAKPGGTYWEPGDQKYRPRPERKRSRPHHGRGIRRFFGALGRAVPRLIVLALVLTGVHWVFGDDGEEPVPVSVFSDQMAQNAPAGTCVATREGWQGDKGRVPSVPCDQEHWGEILGYVVLGAPGSPYPGDEVLQQAAGFECAWLQERHAIRSGNYTTESVYPDPRRWNAGGATADNYATCLVRRVDGHSLPNHPVVDPDRQPTSNPTVTRGLFNRDIGTNPPVGSCVTSKQSYEADRHNVSFSPCDRPHWGEILGYPVLYDPATPWPGDQAVYAAADAACRKLTADAGLDATYRYHVTWPAQAVWVDNPDRRRYAVCTASKADDTPLSGRLR